MDFGLIGEKLGHSCSPEIHRMLGCDYVLHPLPPEELDAFLRARTFRGVNVTIPYKRAVLPYCDALSPAAQRIGCVNTLVRESDGRLTGHNTDYAGLLAMVDRAGIELRGRVVAILGSGGTMRTARAAAEDRGAREIVIVSRSGPVNYENIYDRQDIQVIVNTTPVGMFPRQGSLPLDPGRFSALEGVLDVVYNPLRTALVLRAMELGIPCSGGLGMLVSQAVAASELFLEKKHAPETAGEILAAMEARRSSIVLIGMPGSGKTAVGSILAEALGRELVDTDELVTAMAGMSIPEIFEKRGEAAFRALERQAVAQAGSLGGRVIATGGGAVLDERNLAPLRQNGRIYRLRRSLDRLETKGRPLSKSAAALEEMAARREAHYARFADVDIDNNAPTARTAAERILEDFHAYFGDKRP